MRVSIVSILLAGGALCLGACTTVDSSVMTVAERAEQCRGSAVLTPTGRNTGNPRQDYNCTSPHDSRASRESRADAGGQRNAAIDRSLRRGY